MEKYILAFVRGSGSGSVVSIFSSFLQYQHPVIKIHSFEHETTVTYISWVESKLTSRQTNTIQNEINGCLRQPKNDVNLIRYSCDKFEKFGGEVHLCGKIKTSEQKKTVLKSILTHPAYRGYTRIMVNLRTLFELLFGVKCFHKLARFNFLANDSISFIKCGNVCTVCSRFRNKL